MVRFISCPYGPNITTILSYLPVPPEHQPDAYLNLVPVSGTRYGWSTDGLVSGALGALNYVRLYSIACWCVWTVQPSPLETHVTIDGQAVRFFFNNPASTTVYKVRPWENPDSADNWMSVTTYDKAFILEGRSVNVEFEITGGTVSNLSARVKWARWL